MIDGLASERVYSLARVHRIAAQLDARDVHWAAERRGMSRYWDVYVDASQIEALREAIKQTGRGGER